MLATAYTWNILNNSKNHFLLKPNTNALYKIKFKIMDSIVLKDPITYVGKYGSKISKNVTPII